MRRWIFAVLLAAAVPAIVPISGPISAWAAEYLTSVSDLPLADGLKEQVDKSTVFDTPLGRIVTAYADGNMKPQAVLDFYDDTLPQLGWDKQKSGTYRRKHDILKIDVWGPDEGPTKVSFTLSSQNQ
jgi:hypothetical protein